MQKETILFPKKTNNQDNLKINLMLNLPDILNRI